MRNGTHLSSLQKTVRSKRECIAPEPCIIAMRVRLHTASMSPHTNLAQKTGADFFLTG